MILNTFNIMKPDEAPFSDEATNQNPTKTLPNRDGSSIESPKRPRGRPPGSKNKPKPLPFPSSSSFSSSSPSPAMHPQVLEIPAGLDILDCLARFARRRGLCVCVLAATGLVANVALRQPVAAAIVFRGRFEILSISATFMPPEMVPAPAPAPAISLAGLQGQVVGGTVVGPLVAAGSVVVVAAAFVNPRFYRLPAAAEEEAEEEEEGSGGEEGGERKYYYYYQHHQLRGGQGISGELVYGSHLSPEVVLTGGGRAAAAPY